MIGLPLTAPRPEITGRFPCESCSCGCSTAAYCWDKCCCHTDEEKLAWAAEHDVTPPEFLVARVEASRQPPLDASVSKIQNTCSFGGGCCGPKSDGPPDNFASLMQSMAAHSAKKTRDTKPTSSCSTCGEKKSCDAADNATHPTRWVRLQDAAKCHGIELVWSLLASSVVDFSSFQWNAIDPPLLFRLTLSDEHAVAMSLCPEPPVP